MTRFDEDCEFYSLGVILFDGPVWDTQSEYISTSVVQFMAVERLAETGNNGQDTQLDGYACSPHGLC